MSAIRGKDTAPEMAVRRLLFSMGYRYRLHAKYLPGSPDIVFPGRRKTILVHGCFWHWHASRGCPIAKVPQSRRQFWEHKLRRNRTRDRKSARELKKLGWGALTIWECQLRDPRRLESRIARFLAP